ncbi:cytochrome c-551 precursor [mine drainage metagenome]|uniref:Cytochrome c-551 n=1 Tax=mine drainage metagenome TaxID=410659 RepID=A0A1J5TMA5_9ZZZZ
MSNIRWAILIATMMLSMTAHAAEALRVEIPPEIQSQVRMLGCDACHGWSRTKFGPAWQDVADRYRGQTSYAYKGFNIDSAGEKLPLVAGLVKKISKGGKGEWNEYIPMAPNDPQGIHAKEITNIVNFILSIPPKK